MEPYEDMTEEEYLRAVSELTKLGERPTYRAVIRFLGHGSMGTVRKFVRKHQEQARITSEEAQKACRDVWELAVTEARKQVARELELSERNLDQLSAEHDRLTAEKESATQQVEAIRGELDRVQAELTQTLRRIAELEVFQNKEREASRSEKDALRERLHSAELELARIAKRSSKPRSSED